MYVTAAWTVNSGKRISVRLSQATAENQICDQVEKLCSKIVSSCTEVDFNYAAGLV